MKLVIDIDEETYKAILHCAKNTPGYLTICERIIADGKPLPKGHGDLIDRDDPLADSYCIDDWSGNEVNIVDIMARGNCMMCGKELDEGLFFCKECEAKI